MTLVKTELPVGWAESCLEDVCSSMSSGGTPKRSVQEYWKNGKISWVKISDLHQGIVQKTEECITEKGLEESSAKILPKGTILVSIFASLGELAILGIPAATNQAIVGIRVDESKINKKYLYYYLEFTNDLINRKATQGTQKNINLEILRKIPIKYGSLKTQKTIVSILDHVTSQIHYREKIFKLYQLLIQATFVKLFGNPFLNEKQWDVKPLSELLEKAQYGTSKSLNEKNGTPCLRMSNLNDDGTLDISDLKYLNNENEVEKFVLDKGDILFNRTNSRELIGKTAIFDLDKKFSFAGYLIRLKVNSKICNPFYLNTFLNMPEIKGKIRSKAKGAVGQANINSQEIQELEILFPSLKLQNVFHSILDDIQKSISKNQKLLTMYKELFVSLQDHCFRGKLDS